MKKGQIIEALEITDIASNGRGVGRYEGRVVFVEKLVPGDVARVELYKVKSNLAEAKFVEILTPSANRTAPVCSHFGTCGGCTWQNLSYKSQLQHKEQHVIQNLKKISGMALPEAYPILGAENIYHYRNKLEFTFTANRWLTLEEIGSGIKLEHRNGLGFHIPGKFDKVLDVEECHLQNPKSNSIRNFIREKSLEMTIPYFNLRDQTGILRNLIIRSNRDGHFMVVLSVTEINEHIFSLLDNLASEFPEIISLNYVVNTKRNDTILDLPVICYKGDDHLKERISHLQYKIGPKSFFQTNSLQAEKLYEIVREFAGLKGNEVVYDLYTGTGTIANFIASNCRKVVGLEYVEEAVSDARYNAGLNGITNSEFYSGDIRLLLDENFFAEHSKPDVIITDPPRAGMHEDVVRAIVASKPEKVVYVSCNPSTQARDVALMSAHYKIERIQPVDMFPHTTHVENVMLLSVV